MEELTVEQRLDRLEKYAQVVCRRCERIITLNETLFLPHYSYIYKDETPSRLENKMALCRDCYDNYQKLQGDKEMETQIALGNYMKEIKSKK